MARSNAPSIRRLAGIGMAAGAALALALATADPAGAARAQGVITDAGGTNAIPGSYLVVFKDARMAAPTVHALTSDKAAKAGARVDYTYTAALRGFAGSMSERAARRLAADPDVAYVAQNHRVSIAATQTPTPSWGLDRIDQRDLPLDSSYTYPNTASNVTAYIIDTGIRTTHQDFGGRATWGTNTTGDGNNTDCNGHGTHVAGTVGGGTYGVAKGVHLVAVKVLDCNGSGSFAGVAAGIDWVTQDHTSGPAVANMSLGGSGSDATTENAVRNSIADGVVYAIASGNSNSDACNFTPARVAEAITVNASDSNDARASFSNFGTCTDIFAPGVNITSAWNTSDSATNTISGTSMATPHVTGGAALILGASPSLTPAQVWTTMSNNATLNHITNPGTGSPNRLLFVNTGGSPPPPPPPGDCGSPGQKLVNPGFESGTSGWANATWTIYPWTGIGAPRSGSWSSWISGYGYTATETLQQTVTIPAGCTNSTLSLWLKIATDEYEGLVFDTFTVKVNSTTLATYTNLDATGSYVLRSFNVGAFAGQTVTVSFTGTEDWSLQTSFVLDDLALNAG